MGEAIDFNDVSMDSFHLICRLCLCAGEMEPLFDTSKLEIYQRITLLEASLDDKLPKNICDFCSNQLKAISAFVETCLNSHSLLKKIVEKCEIETATNGFASIDKNCQSPIYISSDSDESITHEVNLNLESIVNDEKLHPKETCDIEKTASDEDNLETASATPHKSVFEEIETDLKDCGLDFSVLSAESEEIKKLEIQSRKKSKQKIGIESEMIELAFEVVAIKEKKCKNCGKIVENLNQHYKQNFKCRPKNFLCATCGKRFPSNNRLADHLNSHSKEQPFKCNLCHRAFSNRNNLRRHKLIHNGIKTLLCHLCGKVYLRHDELRVCLNRHAGKKIPKYGTSQNRKTMVECKVCKKLVNKVSIKVHMQCHDQKFQCNICGKKFSYKYILEIHVRHHTGERPFKCNFCNKDFITKSELKLHTQSHMGEKPFSCHVCNKDFVSKYYLQKHILCHTGEKPFECQFCSKRFRQAPHLKRHVMTHTGEKPYVCDICNRSFSEKFNFAMHMRLHTGERPFKCKLCDKNYCDRGTLTKHVQKTHKINVKNDSNER